MYTAQGTRPDIAYALSRYLIKPYKAHITAAKRVPDTPSIRPTQN